MTAGDDRAAMQAAATLSLVLNRRSSSPRNLVEPIPDNAALQTIMQAAAAAPDHKRLRPYRFVLVPPHRREDLARAFREAKRERDPSASEEDLARAADKAHRGPMLIAIVLQIVRDHPRVSVTDQMLAAGAAIENAMLAAAALGFGSCLRSGQSATSRRVREAMGLGADEDLACFLILGTPAVQPKPRSCEDAGGLLTVWE